MTLKQMIIHTMMLLDEQRGEADIREFTDAAEGVDVRAFINDAYAMVCREDLPLYRQGSVMPDQDGVFNSNDLTDNQSGSFLHVLRVQADGEPLPYEAGSAQGLYRVLAPVQGSVSVTFAYLPPPLQAESDVPRLPEFAHALLCDYAAAQVLRAQGYGGDENYTAHMDVFAQKRMQLQAMPAVAFAGQDSSALGTHIRNKY